MLDATMQKLLNTVSRRGEEFEGSYKYMTTVNSMNNSLLCVL